MQLIASIESISCQDFSRSRTLLNTGRALQASAQGCKALSKAEATERILLAHMQSQVYEDIAASAAAQARPLFGMRLPGLGHACQSELRPGDFCLYEDVPGIGLPSAQERRRVHSLHEHSARIEIYNVWWQGLGLESSQYHLPVHRGN